MKCQHHRLWDIFRMIDGLIKHYIVNGWTVVGRLFGGIPSVCRHFHLYWAVTGSVPSSPNTLHSIVQVFLSCRVESTFDFATSLAHLLRKIRWILPFKLGKIRKSHIVRILRTWTWVEQNTIQSLTITLRTRFYFSYSRGNYSRKVIVNKIGLKMCQ